MNWEPTATMKTVCYIVGYAEGCKSPQVIKEFEVESRDPALISDEEGEGFFFENQLTLEFVSKEGKRHLSFTAADLQDCSNKAALLSTSNNYFFPGARLVLEDEIEELLEGGKLSPEEQERMSFNTKGAAIRGRHGGWYDETHGKNVILPV